MTDKKLSDNEIIKALECHIKGRCHSCPNGKEEIQLLHKPCSRMIAEYALSLINRQKAEIERLKAEQEMADGYAEALEERAKADAIKELAERLKECKYQSSDWSHGEHPYVVEESDIDNLVKEMAGDHCD